MLLCLLSPGIEMFFHCAFSWMPLVSCPLGVSGLCCACDSPGEFINFLVEKL